MKIGARRSIVARRENVHCGVVGQAKGITRDLMCERFKIKKKTNLIPRLTIIGHCL